MPRINLLPWREEKRAQRQRQFVQTALLVALVAAMLLLSAGQFLQHQISLQNSRNALIEQRSARLDAKISEVRGLRKTRSQLLDWIALVQKLEHNRGALVQVFEDIALATTEGLYLTRITRQDGRLTLEGEASGNQQISELMRRLTQSGSLKDPTLTDVSASRDKPGFNRFVLQIRQNIPAEQEAGDER